MIHALDDPPLNVTNPDDPPLNVLNPDLRLNAGGGGADTPPSSALAGVPKGLVFVGIVAAFALVMVTIHK